MSIIVLVVSSKSLAGKIIYYPADSLYAIVVKIITYKNFSGWINVYRIEQVCIVGIVEPVYIF